MESHKTRTHTHTVLRTLVTWSSYTEALTPNEMVADGAFGK